MFIQLLKKCALTVPVLCSNKLAVACTKSKVLYNAEIGLTAEDLAEIDKFIPQPVSRLAPATIKTVPMN